MPTLGLNLARMLVLVLALAGATAGTAVATGGGGGSPPPSGPTLQGENLIAPFAGLDVESTCVEDGTSTVKYHAEGLASGPFPGTFIVDGTITIGPQTELDPPIGEGTIGGPIITLTEAFTIFSGATTISGSKMHTEPIAELAERERATCQDVTELRGITGTGRVVEIEAATTYEATISGPTGTFEDSGRATVVLDLVEITGECAPGVQCESRSGNFDQLFTLSDQAPPPPPPPPPPCDDDEDGDSQGGDGDDQGCDEDEN
jgi:hypothetical protein